MSLEGRKQVSKNLKTACESAMQIQSVFNSINIVHINNLTSSDSKKLCNNLNNLSRDNAKKTKNRNI